MDKELLERLKSGPPFGAIEYDQIIFDALRKSSSASSASSASSSEKPTLIVLCGPPGCGKSKTKKQLIAQEGVTDYIDIDPDVIRSTLMAKGVEFSDDTTMAGITNAFNKRMSDRAQELGLNIVFDTTGQNFRAVSSLLRESKVKGYKTTFAVIWARRDTCKERVASRNASSGDRLVLPDEVAKKIYDGFLENGTASNFLVDYPVSADKIFLYNNDTDNVNADAVLLYSKEGDKVTLSSNFKGFYNMDLTEADPFIKIKDEPGGSSSSKKGGRRRTNRRTYRKNKRSKTKRRHNKKSKRHFK